MTGVLANYEHLTVAPDNLALVAHFLDRRTYLHFNFLSVMRSSIFYAQPLAIDCVAFSDTYLQRVTVPFTDTTKDAFLFRLESVL